jgi:hypothetical protein
MSPLFWSEESQAKKDARLQRGWEPVPGIHTRPNPKPGEAPLTVRWRWTFHPHSELTAGSISTGGLPNDG